ncbi:hypothetical protein GD627_14935 [Arthrobacter yangruifuii]|uniref:Uncharacterized protein n=1 Tax=Arthrobacter yangruifuii TaxID=2606616 RepID=A0A5N6ME05_9MICC|nr:hypothetical protein GD627_14935 [Arthrobacter yangruifuii]
MPRAINSSASSGASCASSSGRGHSRETTYQQQDLTEPEQVHDAVRQLAAQEGTRLRAADGEFETITKCGARRAGYRLPRSPA